MQFGGEVRPANALDQCKRYKRQAIQKYSDQQAADH